MQNLALEDLNDPDVDVVNAAINGLEHLGDASVAEPVVSAYTKLVGLAANDPKIAKAIAAWWSNPSSGARILMDNERFHLNDEQRRKLEAIARLQP
jgi:hypothetical protein